MYKLEELNLKSNKLDDVHGEITDKQKLSFVKRMGLKIYFFIRKIKKMIMNIFKNKSFAKALSQKSNGWSIVHKAVNIETLTKFLKNRVVYTYKSARNEILPLLERKDVILNKQNFVEYYNKLTICLEYANKISEAFTKEDMNKKILEGIDIAKIAVNSVSDLLQVIIALNVDIKALHKHLNVVDDFKDTNIGKENKTHPLIKELVDSVEHFNEQNIDKRIDTNISAKYLETVEFFNYSLKLYEQINNECDGVADIILSTPISIIESENINIAQILSHTNDKYLKNISSSEIEQYLYKLKDVSESTMYVVNNLYIENQQSIFDGSEKNNINIESVLEKAVDLLKSVSYDIMSIEIGIDTINRSNVDTLSEAYFSLLPYDTSTSYNENIVSIFTDYGVIKETVNTYMCKVIKSDVDVSYMGTITFK